MSEPLKPWLIATFVAVGGIIVALGLTVSVLGLPADAGKLLADAPDRGTVTADAVAEPAPPPEPELEHEPAPPPPPVEGQVERTGIVDLSTADTGVFQPGSDPDRPVPVDHDAIDAFVAAAAKWLDTHLEAYRNEQPLDVSGLAGDPDAVTAAIVGSADDLDRVTYAVRVGARGQPEWAEMTVTVEHPDGPTGGVVTFVTADSPDIAVPIAIEAGP